MGRHIFISYVREDDELVDRLASDLRRYGIEVWLDRERLLPGQRWRDSIRIAIRDGALFLACFSRAYEERSRSYMNEELALAIEELRLQPSERRWFVPVLLTPGANIPDIPIGGGETLRDLQWLDLASNWNAGLRTLVVVTTANLPSADNSAGVGVVSSGARADASLMQEREQRIAPSLNIPQYFSCFLSYSSSDEQFALQLYGDMRSYGVRCWFAPEDLKIGATIRDALDEAIRLHDKLLVVLSTTSVASQWVEQEVERALQEERDKKRSILFPVRIDDAIFSVPAGWAAFVRNSRHIGDFREWKSREQYVTALARLLRDLTIPPPLSPPLAA